MAFAPMGADKCFEEGRFRERFQSFAKSSGIVMPVNVGIDGLREINSQLTRDPNAKPSRQAPGRETGQQGPVSCSRQFPPLLRLPS